MAGAVVREQRQAAAGVLRCVSARRAVPRRGPEGGQSRRRQEQRQAESGAAELLRRVGDLVLSSQDNHLESNQALLETLRSARALLQSSLAAQSSDDAPKRRSIKRRKP